MSYRTAPARRLGRGMLVVSLFGMASALGAWAVGGGYRAILVYAIVVFGLALLLVVRVGAGGGERPHATADARGEVPTRRKSFP